MVSTVDVLSEQPWGKTYFESHEGFCHTGYWKAHKREPTTFKAQFKLIQDRKGNYWSRGDIILFNSGYYNWNFDRRSPWKKWFLTKETYLEALKNDAATLSDKKVPNYARLEYGMLLARYKWIKDKNYHGKIYQDYGSIIMMLTGSKVGHIRRYYLKTPYAQVSKYPYDHITPFYTERYGLEEIPQLERIKQAMSTANTKDEFIVNLVSSLTGV
jgi:hypothetical protein